MHAAGVGYPLQIRQAPCLDGGADDARRRAVDDDEENLHGWLLGDLSGQCLS
jgi:hypothetical protein